MDNADAVVAAMQARPNSLRYNKKRLALQAIACDEVDVASMAVSEQTVTPTTMPVAEPELFPLSRFMNLMPA